MRAVIRKVFLAKGDALNGLEEPRVLEPGGGFSIGPSIYADVVLTTAGGTRRATGGRRCCAFYLDALGKLWLHHGGRLSHLTVNGAKFASGSRLLSAGDRIAILTAAGDVALELEVC
ncbi:MAG: hypothetical protein QM723_03495 [Myxococcaceae bacterium]